MCNRFKNEVAVVTGAAAKMLTQGIAADVVGYRIDAGSV
jgi:hypothetical protein